MRDLLVPAESDRLAANNFDALRLVLALLVVWSHCFALRYGSEDGEPVSLLFGGVYNAGNVAVLGFFTISGFLITLSYTRSRSWWAYLKRRVLRIYPGYLVATTLCALVVVPAFATHMLDPPAAIARGLASNLLLRNYLPASDAFGGGPVNGALWSIPYEFWCYLGVLALGAAGLARRASVVAFLAFAVMAVRVWLDLTGRKTGGGQGLLGLLQLVFGYPYFWFVVLPSFLLGAAVLHLRRILPRRRWLAAGLLAALVLAAHLPLADPLRLVVTRSLMPLVLAYLIFYAAFSPTLRWHRAARFGDFSYGTYLYGFPVQQMLRWSIGPRLAFAGYVALSLGGALAAGAMSWMLVERWFLRRAERKASARVLGDETVIVAP